MAFVAACCFRGASVNLLEKAAGALQIATPFSSGQDEIKTLKAIANDGEDAKKLRFKLKFNRDEGRRAALLLKDDYQLPSEDFYDPSTY